MQKRIDTIPAVTMRGLAAWDWPGNIRELENFIERAVILTRGKALEAPLSELRRAKQPEPAPAPVSAADVDIARIVKETIASLQGNSSSNGHAKKQREDIIQALTECKGQVGGADGAAVRLGMGRTTLIARMKRLGINPYDYV